MRATGPGQPAHLLVDVVDTLSALDIPYAVVGAFAVSFYGVPRSTNDADAAIWLKEPSQKNALLSRLITVGYRAELRMGDLDDPISGVILVRDENQNRLDLLLGLRGMAPDASQRCVTALLLGNPIRFIGPEDLIAMKLFAGGHQDLEDARGILKVSGQILNKDLLQSVVHRYGGDQVRTLNAILREES